MRKLDNEQYQFRTLTGYNELDVHLSGRAGEWLSGTTRTNDNYVVSHRTLMHDLLSRMQLTAMTSTGFRRPQQLREGQAQYSEIQLQTEWNIGRKVVRRLLDAMQSVGLISMEKSTVASILTFPFVKGWSIEGRGYTKNPFFLTNGDVEQKGVGL
mgnify:CR=1 FL=1